mmetsp:Transcript_8033/g.9162  ORF Transcript_8033/g.9162 Transcript_8033/m.9162 type:complete len:126 (+) Transcript_8033:241-618(+)
MSDGSHRIFRIDPANLIEFDQDEFETAYDIDQCTDESHFDAIYSIFDPETGERLENLDELEMVNSNLYVNLYDESMQTFSIVKIDTGISEENPESETMTILRTYDFCLLHELLCEELSRSGASMT